MDKILTAVEIAELKAKGGKVTKHPRLVEGVMETPALVEAIKELAAAQQRLAEARDKTLLKAIADLTSAIARKEFKGQDMSKLITAIAGLKQEAVAVHDPVDYEMTFERDENRHYIKSGVRFTAIVKRLDS